MNKKLMEKWVKALRSGKYKQGDGRLYDEKTNTYCCLGVLCEIEGIKYSKTNEYYQGKSLVDESGRLPKKYKVKSGFFMDNLAQLNDHGLTFKQIAKIIEKNYKDL